MDNTLNRLRQHQSATPSRWREEAEKRKANKEWLRYSQNIAMRMLDKMEADGITMLVGSGPKINSHKKTGN